MKKRQSGMSRIIAAALSVAITVPVLLSGMLVKAEDTKMETKLFDSENYAASISNQSDSMKPFYENHSDTKTLITNFNKLNGGEITAENRVAYIFEANKDGSFTFVEKYIKDTVDVIEAASDVGAGKFHFEVMCSSDQSTWTAMDTTDKFTEVSTGTAPTNVERTYTMQLSGDAKYVKIVFPHKRSYAPEMDAAHAASGGSSWWLGGPGHWQLGLYSVAYMPYAELPVAPPESEDGDTTVLFDAANYEEALKNQLKGVKILLAENNGNLALEFNKLNYGEINEGNRAYYLFNAATGSKFTFTECYIKEAIDVIEAASDVGAGKFHFEVYTSPDNEIWTAVDTAGKFTEEATGAAPTKVERNYEIQLGETDRYVKIMFPHKRSYAAELDAAKGKGDSWWLGGPGHWQLGLKKIQYNMGEPFVPPVEDNSAYDTVIDFSKMEDKEMIKAYVDMDSYSMGALTLSETTYTDRETVAHPLLCTSWEAIYYGKVNKDEPAYFTYLVKPGKAFRMISYRNKDCDTIEQKTGESFKFKFMGSADGKTWSEVPMNYEPKAYGFGGFQTEEKYSTDAIPQNVKYLKVEFPHKKAYTEELGDGNVGNWQLAVKSVAFTKGSYSSDDDPVMGEKSITPVMIISAIALLGVFAMRKTAKKA